MEWSEFVYLEAQREAQKERIWNFLQQILDGSSWSVYTDLSAEVTVTEKIDRLERRLRNEGRQKGLQEGLQQGEALMLLQLLRLKFGPLGSKVEKQVRSADTDLLLEWGTRILSVERLEDVLQSYEQQEKSGIPH